MSVKFLVEVQWMFVHFATRNTQINALASRIYRL